MTLNTICSVKCEKVRSLAALGLFEYIVKDLANYMDNVVYIKFQRQPQENMATKPQGIIWELLLNCAQVKQIKRCKEVIFKSRNCRMEMRWKTCEDIPYGIFETYNISNIPKFKIVKY